MVIIAVYLYFVSALAGYRASKYWPKYLTGLSWLVSPVYIWGCLLVASILLICVQGGTLGLLIGLCIYMTIVSSVVFFVACGRSVRLFGFVLFHVLCVLGLIGIY